ncbi:MAG: RING finger protein [Promethearchaeota archaeon]
MSFQENPELDLKLTSHVPILWKRKIRNFIKDDHQHALEFFFRSFKQGKNTTKMKYGLEQSLPESLYFILSSFEELDNEEASLFFDLIATNKFIAYFPSLERKKQELILDQIYNHWDFGLNHESIRKILSQLDSSIGTLLYDKITEEKAERNTKFIKILVLWGEKVLTHYLKIYAPNNVDLILKTFLESKSESHHRLLLPFLQDAATKNWKMIINTTIELNTNLPPDVIYRIFSDTSSRTKQKIGNYIITQSLVDRLAFLFTDFDIFKSALTSKKLTITTQTLLEPYLQQHIAEHFDQIVKLGKRISFPQLSIAMLIDHSSFKILLDMIRLKRELLQYWEDVLIICSRDALHIVLSDFLQEGKNKAYLIPLLNRLISLELYQFWFLFKSLPPNSFSKLHPILIHAFDLSITIIGEVISSLPKDHLSFIFERIIPQCVTTSPKILYSLLSGQGTSYIQEPAIQRAVLELIKLDPDELLIIVLIRLSKIITDSRFSNSTNSLLDKIINHYTINTLTIIDTQKLNSLIPIVNSFFSSLSLVDVENIILPFIVTLKSHIFNSIVINQLEKLTKGGKENLPLLRKLISNYEEQDFSIEGKKILYDFFRSLIGKSANDDLLIFSIFKQRPRSQSLLLPVLFENTSVHTIENILLESPIEPLEENILKTLVYHLEIHPPEKPEEYFFNLYETLKEKEDAQRAILPLLGEFCSWNNLSKLMDLSEKEKYYREYEKALIRFSSRFDIHSHKSLQQIWISGLKDVYSRLKKTTTLYQSQCPQCGNPILEKQKNCGFCSQRLSCIICRASVVELQTEEEVVQCPQCSSFFHRHHLLESVKFKKTCPVCNVSLRETDVSKLPSFNFFYK